MKITMDKNVVDFSPETAEETACMEILWRKIIDCAGDSKTLAPIGEYIPTKKNQLSFVIEGGSAKTVFSDQAAVVDTTYTCAICNKYMNVKAGDSVPLCCGKLMECID
ncbi:MAG: hypothetical protein PHI06_10525 [Desulfobulbaceae bacterium]|nr:hypothetical protein [Desulfobulbaceae bacterium]